MSDGREVTEAEMRAHVKAWPRKLVPDVAAMYEPPYVTFNDFTYGDWPESVVASYCGPDKQREPPYADLPASHFKIHRELTQRGSSGV